MLWRRGERRAFELLPSNVRVMHDTNLCRLNGKQWCTFKLIFLFLFFLSFSLSFFFFVENFYHNIFNICTLNVRYNETDFTISFFPLLSLSKFHQQLNASVVKSGLHYFREYLFPSPFFSYKIWTNSRRVSKQRETKRERGGDDFRTE